MGAKMKMTNEQKVIYCEFLFMQNPKEIETTLKDALKRFEMKFKAIQNFNFKDGCFIGIKDLNNNWIKQN